MTAAEHVEAAEALLGAVQYLAPADVVAMMAKAQVHATLAAALAPPAQPWLPARTVAPGAA